MDMEKEFNDYSMTLGSAFSVRQYAKIVNNALG